MPSRRRLSSTAVKMALRDRPPVLGLSRHGRKNFGREDNFIALRKVAQGASDDFLARAAGIAVGRVEEIDAEFPTRAG